MESTAPIAPVEPVDPVAPEPGADAPQDRAYLPATADPSLSLDETSPLDQGGALERLEALYHRMRPCRQQLDAILGFCREARTLAEIEEEKACATKASYSVYDVVGLCRLLVRAGGLDEQEPPAPEAQVVEIDGVAYLEPAPAENGVSRFATTAAGRAYLAQVASLAPFEAMLAEEPRYEHVYRILLDTCANDGGATAQQLDDAVIDDPELQEPRMYASYFYDRLDAAGLIAWTGPWTLTDLGRSAIAYLDSRA